MLQINLAKSEHPFLFMLGSLKRTGSRAREVVLGVDLYLGAFVIPLGLPKR